MRGNEKQSAKPVVKATHRVHEYEEASLKTKSKGFECTFSEFKYQEKSFFIEKVSGTVETDRFRIFVTWDDNGQAFIQGSRAKEFDLMLSN